MVSKETSPSSWILERFDTHFACAVRIIMFIALLPTYPCLSFYSISIQHKHTPTDSVQHSAWCIGKVQRHIKKRWQKVIKIRRNRTMCIAAKTIALRQSTFVFNYLQLKTVIFTANCIERGRCVVVGEVRKIIQNSSYNLLVYVCIAASIMRKTTTATSRHPWTTISLQIQFFDGHLSLANKRCVWVRGRRTGCCI